MAARGAQLAALLRRAQASRDATAVARPADPRATEAQATAAAGNLALAHDNLTHEFDAFDANPDRHGYKAVDFDPGLNLRAGGLATAQQAADSTAKDAASRRRDIATVLRVLRMGKAPARPTAVGQHAPALNDND